WESLAVRGMLGGHRRTQAFDKATSIESGCWQVEGRVRPGLRAPPASPLPRSLRRRSLGPYRTQRPPPYDPSAGGCVEKVGENGADTDQWSLDPAFVDWLQAPWENRQAIEGVRRDDEENICCR